MSRKLLAAMLSHILCLALLLSSNLKPLHRTYAAATSSWIGWKLTVMSSPFLLSVGGSAQKQYTQSSNAWNGNFSPLQLLQILFPSSEDALTVDGVQSSGASSDRSSFDDGNVQKVISILQSNVQHWSFIESQLLEPNVNLAMPEIFIPLKHLTATLEVLGNIFYLRDDFTQAQECLERACPLMELLPSSLLHEMQTADAESLAATRAAESMQSPPSPGNAGVSSVQQLLYDLHSIIAGSPVQLDSSQSGGSTGNLHAPSLHRSSSKNSYGDSAADGRAQSGADGSNSYATGCFALLRSVYGRIYGLDGRKGQGSHLQQQQPAIDMAPSGQFADGSQFSDAQLRSSRKSWRRKYKQRDLELKRRHNVPVASSAPQPVLRNGPPAASDSPSSLELEEERRGRKESRKGRVDNTAATIADKVDVGVKRQGLLDRLFMSDEEEEDTSATPSTEPQSNIADVTGRDVTDVVEVISDEYDYDDVDDDSSEEDDGGNVDYEDVDDGEASKSESANANDAVDRALAGDGSDFDIDQRLSELRLPFEHLRAELMPPESSEATDNGEETDSDDDDDVVDDDSSGSDQHSYTAGRNGLGLRGGVATPVAAGEDRDSSTTQRQSRRNAKHGSRKHINQRRSRSGGAGSADDGLSDAGAATGALSAGSGGESGSVVFDSADNRITGHSSDKDATVDASADVDGGMGGGGGSTSQSSSSTSIIAEDMEVMLRKFVREESLRGQRDLLQVARKYFDELDINFPNMDYNEYAANMDMGQVFLEVMARVSEEGYEFIGPELEEWQEVGISYLASTAAAAASTAAGGGKGLNADNGGAAAAGSGVDFGVGMGINAVSFIEGVRIYTNDPDKQAQVEMLQSLIKEKKISLDEILGGEFGQGTLLGGITSLADEVFEASNLENGGFLPYDIGSGIILEIDSSAGARREIAVELAGSYFNAFSLADRNRMLVLSAFDIVHTEPNDPFDLGLGFKLGIMDNDRGRQSSYGGDGRGGGGSSGSMLFESGEVIASGLDYQRSTNFDSRYSAPPADDVNHLRNLFSGARQSGRKRRSDASPSASSRRRDGGGGGQVHGHSRHEQHDKEASASMYEEAISAYDLGLNGVPLRSSVPTLRLDQGDWTLHLFVLFLLATALIVAAAYYESQKNKRGGASVRQRSRLTGQRGKSNSSSLLHSVNGFFQHLELMLNSLANVTSSSDHDLPSNQQSSTLVSVPASAADSDSPTSAKSSFFGAADSSGDMLDSAWRPGAMLLTLLQWLSQYLFAMMGWLWRLFTAVDDFITDCAIRLGLLMGVLDPEEDFSQYKHRQSTAHGASNGSSNATRGSSSDNSSKYSRSQRTRSVGGAGTSTASHQAVSKRASGGTGTASSKPDSRAGGDGSASFFGQLLWKIICALLSHFEEKGERQNQHSTTAVQDSGCAAVAGAATGALPSSAATVSVERLMAPAQPESLADVGTHSSTEVNSADKAARSKSIGKKAAKQKSTPSGKSRSQRPAVVVTSDAVKPAVPTPASAVVASEDESSLVQKDSEGEEAGEQEEEEEDEGSFLAPLVMNTNSAGLLRHVAAVQSNLRDPGTPQQQHVSGIAVRDKGPSSAEDEYGEWAEARKRGGRRLQQHSADEAQSSHEKSGRSAAQRPLLTLRDPAPTRSSTANASSSRSAAATQSLQNTGSNINQRQSNRQISRSALGAQKSSSGNANRSIDSSRSNSITSPTSSPAAAVLSGGSVGTSAATLGVIPHQQLPPAFNHMPTAVKQQHPQVAERPGHHDPSQESVLSPNSRAAQAPSVTAAAASGDSTTNGHAAAAAVVPTAPPGLGNAVFPSSLNEQYQLLLLQQQQQQLQLQQQRLLLEQQALGGIAQLHQASSDPTLSDSRFLQQFQLEQMQRQWQHQQQQQQQQLQQLLALHSLSHSNGALKANGAVDLFAVSNAGLFGAMNLNAASAAAGDFQQSDAGGDADADTDADGDRAGVTSMAYLSNLVNFLDNDSNDNPPSTGTGTAGDQWFRSTTAAVESVSSITSEAQSLYGLSANAPSFQPSVPVGELLSAATTPLTPASFVTANSTPASVSTPSLFLNGAAVSNAAATSVTNISSSNNNSSTTTPCSRQLVRSASGTTAASVNEDELQILAGLDAVQMGNTDALLSPDIKRSRIESYSSKKPVGFPNRTGRSGSDLSVDSASPAAASVVVAAESDLAHAADLIAAAADDERAFFESVFAGSVEMNFDEEDANDGDSGAAGSK